MWIEQWSHSRHGIEVEGIKVKALQWPYGNSVATVSSEELETSLSVGLRQPRSSRAAQCAVTITQEAPAAPQRVAMNMVR